MPEGIDCNESETGERARDAMWALMMAFVGVDEDNRASLVRFAREWRRVSSQYVNREPITVGK